jgi:hypothetical protein
MNDSVKREAERQATAVGLGMSALSYIQKRHPELVTDFELFIFDETSVLPEYDGPATWADTIDQSIHTCAHIAMAIRQVAERGQQ